MKRGGRAVTRVILLACLAFAVGSQAHAEFGAGGDEGEAEAGSPLQRKLPDLRIFVIDRQGLPSKVKVAIKNIGEAQAAATDGAYVCQVGIQGAVGFYKVPVLQPGEQHTVVVDCSSSGKLTGTKLKSISVNGMVNGKYEVEESNYSNNNHNF